MQSLPLMNKRAIQALVSPHHTRSDHLEPHANGLVFVRDRAKDVLLLAHQAYMDQTHLYQMHHAFFGAAPQHENLPKGMTRGSPEHVVFLFLTTLVTLQSSSDEGFRQSVRLYETLPECFTPRAIDLVNTLVVSPQRRFTLGAIRMNKRAKGKKKAPRKPQNVLEAHFQAMGFNKPGPWSHYWADTVKTLYEEYAGDPLAIIKDVETVDGFLAKKKACKREGKRWWFNGYGPKLFSLFCIFCEELGLVTPVVDAFPVDVHIQRIALATGIIAPMRTVIGDTTIAEFLRHNLVIFCRKHSIDRVDLAHALWFLGSKACTRCYKTACIEQICPIEALCVGSPATIPYWRRGRWELTTPWNPKGSRVVDLL